MKCFCLEVGKGQGCSRIAELKKNKDNRGGNVFAKKKKKI